MSTKRLTDDELASFLIGQAIRKQLDAGGHDAETLEHIEAVFGWLKKWIPPDELHCVSLLTGYMINGDFAFDHGAFEPLRKAAKAPWPPPQAGQTRRHSFLTSSLETSEAKQPESCFAITLTVIAFPRCTVILF